MDVLVVFALQFISLGDRQYSYTLRRYGTLYRTSKHGDHTVLELRLRTTTLDYVCVDNWSNIPFTAIL